VFNVRASYREEAEALVEYLYAKGCRRVGFFGQADAYGKSGEVAVASALQRRGLSIVNSVWYRRGAMFRSTTSLKEQLSALRNSGADAVILFGVYGPCARLIREARMANWNVPMANVSFVDSDILLRELTKYSNETGRELASNLVNSEVVPSPEESRSRLALEFREHVAAGQRGYVVFEGWLNAAVVVEALRRCKGDVTRAQFVHALDSLQNWDPGLGLAFHFNSETHQALHTVWLAASRNGKWVGSGEYTNGRYEEHPR
jgi:ABC-type branched-subunit amino acid transport system substrate-binding protein